MSNPRLNITFRKRFLSYFDKKLSSIYKQIKGSCFYLADMSEGYGTVLYDRSGRNLESTLSNMDTPVNCWGNGSLIFDGVNDYVEINPFIPASEFTLEVWVKLTSGYGIFTFCNGTQYWGVGVVSTTGKLSVYHNASSQNYYKESGLNISDGETRHIVMTYGSSTNISIYANGSAATLGGNAVTALTGIAGTQKARLGARTSATTSYMAGTIYKAAAYNRVLTPDEISRLYTAEKRYI